MTKTKQLHNKISKKLEKLSELLNKVDEVRAVKADDPNTWDLDTLYSLIDNCQKVIKFLEDQPIKGKYDEFGQPLTEDGLCSLVDEYHSEEEDSEDI